MTLSEQDQASIRNYLLGQLSDEEQEKVEGRLMTEDDLFAELEISKTELMEEYRAGQLQQNEQTFFEGHFLASKEGKQSYLFAAALDHIHHRQQATKRVTSFTAFLSKQRWAVATATAAALVAVVAIVVNISRPGAPYPITLANSILSRDTGAENLLPLKVKLPPHASELRASLKLPKAFPSGTRFKAILDNRTETKSVAVVEQNDQLVTVAIPVSELPPGEYSLRLTATMVDGAEDAISGFYRFDIE